MDVKVDQALYILGFSRTNLKNDASTEWLTAASVCNADFAGIRYWFKLIDRSEFEGPAGEANLASLVWLTPRVLAHDAAVSALSKLGPFYPSRFGTLFSTHESVHTLLQLESQNLSVFLDDIEGRNEWGIKCIANREVSAKCYAARNGLTRSPVLSSGKDYLRSRQICRAIDGQTRTWLNEESRVVQQTLNTMFGRVAVRPRVPKSDGTDVEELICNLACLPLESETKALTRWIESWNTTQYGLTGLRLELSGPWPTYSFCPSLTGGMQSTI